MKQLGRIIAFTKRLTPYYIMIVVASVFVTAANIVVPFIIGRATDTAVSAATGATSTSAAITTVLWLAAAFFLLPRRQGLGLSPIRTARHRRAGRPRES